MQNCQLGVTEVELKVATPVRPVLALSVLTAPPLAGLVIWALTTAPAMGLPLVSSTCTLVVNVEFFLPVLMMPEIPSTWIMLVSGSIITLVHTGAEVFPNASVPRMQRV